MQKSNAQSYFVSFRCSQSRLYSEYRIVRTIKKLNTAKRENERAIVVDVIFCVGRSPRLFDNKESRGTRNEAKYLARHDRRGKERTKRRKRAFRLARLYNFTVSPAVFTRPVKKKKKIREMKTQRDSLLCSDGEFFRICEDKRADRFHATFTQPRDGHLAGHFARVSHCPSADNFIVESSRRKICIVSFIFFLLLSFLWSRQVKENRFVRIECTSWLFYGLCI